ncbi:MAG: DUF6066 family protein [Myxococcales bacterium]|jgi:hypothetical protein
MGPGALPLAVALVAAQLSAAAPAEPSEFSRLQQRAEAVDNLASFLDRYVGRCPPSPDAAECKQRAKRFRAETTGKLFYVRLGADATRLLQPGGHDEAAGEFTFNLTPFFNAGGLGLTEGKPLGLDKQGRPRIGLIPLVAPMPADALPMDMERLVRTQNIRIELVFKPLGAWSLKAKETLEGVRAKLVAIRLTNARTGEQIALRIDER